MFACGYQALAAWPEVAFALGQWDRTAARILSSRPPIRQLLHVVTRHDIHATGGAPISSWRCDISQTDNFAQAPHFI